MPGWHAVREFVRVLGEGAGGDLVFEDEGGGAPGVRGGFFLCSMSAVCKRPVLPLCYPLLLTLFLLESCVRALSFS